ncbi:MAG: hypothetical protein CMI58_05710 [Parcubacteria group bacterium]|jgi:hypothetical protein|nr:hypothetical protein [Parcubacteria group bacterium]|tara:strand:- start:205 stop:615 length:411 start_codon:yes stop_codon:yes gene_type:complete
MGESLSHIRLVEALYKWVSQSLLNGSTGGILIDKPESPTGGKPPKINSFIPDLCVPYTPNKLFVIGEAKTVKDLEKNHSIEQFEAFLKECKKHKYSLLVVAVPWFNVRLAESMLNYLKEKVGADRVEIKVLDQLPG